MSKNRKHNAESIEKMRQARLGKKRAPFSAEWKNKLSLSLIGNTHTKGHKLTEEHKAKISFAVKGSKHPLFGKKFSDESRAKMSKSHKGCVPWNKGKKYPQISGERHHNWKGGVTDQNHAIRTSLEFKLWRKAVFTRDNFTCIECHLSGGWNKKLKRKIILNADHIKPFALYPELRFAIDNGRTLCKECHMKTPTYGFRIINYISS